MGYKLIYINYLGLNNINQMASGAEKKLAHCTYTGEKINWKFDKYATLHQEKHNILKSLKEHEYTGIDHISKVRYPREGIKTTVLDSVRTHRMSEKGLRQDFDGCVTLYKDF